MPAFVLQKQNVWPANLFNVFTIAQL